MVSFQGSYTPAKNQRDKNAQRFFRDEIIHRYVEFLKNTYNAVDMTFYNAIKVYSHFNKVDDEVDI